jgi:hypothetical protein
MIEKIKKLHRKYKDWEKQEVYFYLGWCVIYTNNIKLLIFSIIYYCVILLLIKL